METLVLTVLPARKGNLENLVHVEQLVSDQMGPQDHLDLEDLRVNWEKPDHLGPWV